MCIHTCKALYVKKRSNTSDIHVHMCYYHLHGCIMYVQLHYCMLLVPASKSQGYITPFNFLPCQPHLIDLICPALFFIPAIFTSSPYLGSRGCPKNVTQWCATIRSGCLGIDKIIKSYPVNITMESF